MGDRFWDSVSDLGYERDPKFARYIVDRRNDYSTFFFSKQMFRL